MPSFKISQNQVVIFVVLVAITLFGFMVRFWDLGFRPSGLLADEANYGYIAYSLIKTGADEHGQSWPLIFTAFGDQKLPAYAYSLVPFIAVFGLESWVVRLPSALAGTALIPAIFWLVKSARFRTGIALTLAFAVAVSPWTFFLSRGGYESNLALLFFTLGTASALSAVHSKNSKWWWLAAACWGATWWAYIPYRAITAILILILSTWFVFTKKWKLVGQILLVFGLVVIPLLVSTSLGTNLARFQQVGLLNDQGIVTEVNEKRTFCDVNLPRLLCYAMYNKATLISRNIFDQYLFVVSPQFLFLNSQEAPYLNIKNYGQFYWWYLPVFYLGLVGVLANVTLLTTKTKRFSIETGLSIFIVLLLLLVPLPAIIGGGVQKVRVSALVVPSLLILAAGFEQMTNFFNKDRFNLFLFGFNMLVVISFSFFFINYLFIHTVKHDIDYMSHVEHVFRLLENYTDSHRVVIEPFFSDPIMMYAFYHQIDPAFYQQNVELGELETSGFQHAVKLGSVEEANFNPDFLSCQAVAKQQPTVFVTNRDLGADWRIDVVRSRNEALTYAYIYDANGYGTQVDCSQFSDQDLVK